MNNDIRSTVPSILEILLLDRTKSKPNTPQNIIWANETYKDYGKRSYAPTAQIKPELITGKKSDLIVPRAFKAIELQKQRAKTKAEVFTPTSPISGNWRGQGRADLSSFL